MKPVLYYYCSNIYTPLLLSLSICIIHIISYYILIISLLHTNYYTSLSSLSLSVIVKAGWGDWAGPGAGGMQISQKVLNKRDQLITKVQKEHDLKVVNRKDSKMMNVMLSNRRIKTSSKYKISEIPHPYTSIEEYERSLQMPLGEEWNSTDVVKNYTQPEIKLRPGRVIEPIKLSKKRNNSTTTGAAVETRLNKPSKKAKK